MANVMESGILCGRAWCPMEIPTTPEYPGCRAVDMYADAAARWPADALAHSSFRRDRDRQTLLRRLRFDLPGAGPCPAMLTGSRRHAAFGQPRARRWPIGRPKAAVNEPVGQAARPPTSPGQWQGESRSPYSSASPMALRLIPSTWGVRGRAAGGGGERGSGRNGVRAHPAGPAGRPEGVTTRQPPAQMGDAIVAKSGPRGV